MKGSTFVAGAIVVGLAVGAVSSSGHAQQGPAQPPAKQVYGSWMFSCEQVACQVFLSLADDKTKEAKLSWAFLYDSRKLTLSTIVRLPPMTALPPGVRVYVDEKTSFTWPFQFCDGSSCSAVSVLTNNDFAALKRPNKTIIQFFEYGRTKPTSYQIPMDGLAEAAIRLIAEAKVTR